MEIVEINSLFEGAIKKVIEVKESYPLNRPWRPVG
jgi:hypothetical protein